MIGPREGRRRLRVAVHRAQARAWYLRMAGAVPAQPTMPLRISPVDHQLSPLTGLTRATWIGLARGLLENVLQYSDGLTRPLKLPPSPAAGYPRLSLTGRQLFVHEAYVEAVARTMVLAACLLADEPGLTLHGRRVADYYAELLLRGVDPGGNDSFGPPPVAGFNQRTVEAGLMAIALRTAPRALWDPLGRGERERVLDWFEAFRNAPVHDTNWRWLAVLILTFLKLNGRPADSGVVESHLRRLLAMHAGGGWFRDGQAFDYYSAWAMQLFPILWADWDGDAYPELRADLHSHNDDFLQTYPHVFSRRGSMPAWGRSLCYRFAASAPLSVAFMRPGSPVIEPGFARRLASGNLLQFLGRRDAVAHGLLTLGFYGRDSSLVDPYSCVASPYWAALAFLSLALPASNPFWSAVENEGFWADPPAVVHFADTGLWVEHDSESGRTRLHAPQRARQWDRRYNQPYFEAL
jgi:hypothetical protein